MQQVNQSKFLAYKNLLSNEFDNDLDLLKVYSMKSQLIGF